MKYLIYLIMLLFGLMIVSADPWVANFNDCPSSWEGTDCLVGGELVCGYDTGESPALQCSDPSEISAPATNSTTYSTNDNSSFDGGYFINCIDYDSGDPYCDSDGDDDGLFRCERNESCWGDSAYRQTICLANTFNHSVCGDCQAGVRWDCYGDTDCEATSTSDCNNTAVDNTRYDTSTCNTGLEGGASGTCECDPNYFPCDGGTPSAPTLDSDGCEHWTGKSCGGGTGTEEYNECLDATYANCTSTNNLDCDNSDGDSNIFTCNTGGSNNYCEISEGASCLNSTDTGTGGTYEANECYGTTGGNCTSSGTYLDCDDSDGDGNELTCNVGNGCEIQDGGSCTVGTLSGTYDGCSGGQGNCVVTKSYFETGTQTNYSTSAAIALLWGHDWGSGPLMNLTNNNYNNSFGANASGHPFSEALLNCDTIDTDATGRFSCGTDQGGIDTNASNCADGEYLDGDGDCTDFNTTALAALENSTIVRTSTDLSGGKIMTGTGPNTISASLISVDASERFNTCRGISWTGAANVLLNVDPISGVGITVTSGSSAISFDPGPNSRVLLGNESLQWPNADGTDGQVLTTNGSKKLYWSSAAGADNLGNHFATQNLDMMEYSVINATDLRINQSGNINLGASGENISYDGTSVDITSDSAVRLQFGGADKFGVVTSGSQFYDDAIFSTTSQLGFFTSSTYIQAPTSGDLLIRADDYIEINGTNILFPHLTNCDTINTTSDGTLVCGTDATGTGDGTGGWTNSSTQTNTSLHTFIHNDNGLEVWNSQGTPDLILQAYWTGSVDKVLTDGTFAFTGSSASEIGALKGDNSITRFIATNNEYIFELDSTTASDSWKWRNDSGGIDVMEMDMTGHLAIGPSATPDTSRLKVVGNVNITEGNLSVTQINSPNGVPGMCFQEGGGQTNLSFGALC